jgi:UDP-N-acetylglucosamine 2-epimerase (non-hydrolysing)
VKVLHVLGSHAGFLRVAPVFRALRAAGAESQLLVYAGHREDLVPRDRLLEELELPAPNHVLGVSSGSSSARTGRSVIALEAIVSREGPDWIFAVGDVDASLAAALVGRKNGVPLAHLEAGLRSRNGTSPAEVNRLLTDRLADALFVAERATHQHLLSEGISPDRIHFVGSTVADAVERLREPAAALDLPSVMGLEDGSYLVALMTSSDGLPGSPELDDFLRALEGVAFETGWPTILALDPLAAAAVHDQQLEPLLGPVTAVSTPGYLELIALVGGAGAVISNVSEVLDAATVLGVPFVALGDLAIGRETTLGEGRSVKRNGIDGLAEIVIDALAKRTKPRLPERWDGRAARRVAAVTTAA